MSNRRHSSTDPISALELFESCTRTERDLVDRLATVTTVARGTVLCRQGGEGATFYVVVEGTAEVAVDGESLTTLGPGTGFGEVALLRAHGRRIATVTASTPMTLVVFSRPEFHTLVAEVPDVARRVLNQSARCLAAARRAEGELAAS